jgi:hypothetical protein
MRFKDKFFACLSLGERTYRTERSDKFSNTPLLFLFFFFATNLSTQLIC